MSEQDRLRSPQDQEESDNKTLPTGEVATLKAGRSAKSYIVLKGEASIIIGREKGEGKIWWMGGPKIVGVTEIIELGSNMIAILRNNRSIPFVYSALQSPEPSEK